MPTPAPPPTWWPWAACLTSWRARRNEFYEDFRYSQEQQDQLLIKVEFEGYRWRADGYYTPSWEPVARAPFFRGLGIPDPAVLINEYKRGREHIEQEAFKMVSDWNFNPAVKSAHDHLAMLRCDQAERLSLLGEVSKDWINDEPLYSAVWTTPGGELREYYQADNYQALLSRCP